MSVFCALGELICRRSKLEVEGRVKVMVARGRDSERTVGPECGLGYPSLLSRQAEATPGVLLRGCCDTAGRAEPALEEGREFGGRGLLEQLRKRGQA